MNRTMIGSGWEAAQQLYDELNVRYWLGRLPRYQIRAVKWGSSIGHTDSDRQQINLDPALSGQALREVLLHEMCHVAVAVKHPEKEWPEGHGRKFQRELHGLLRQGEAWAAREIDISIVTSRGDAKRKRFYYTDIERGLAAQKKYLEKYLPIATSGQLAEIDAIERHFRRIKRAEVLAHGLSLKAQGGSRKT